MIKKHVTNTLGSESILVKKNVLNILEDLYLSTLFDPTLDDCIDYSDDGNDENNNDPHRSETFINAVKDDIHKHARDLNFKIVGENNPKANFLKNTSFIGNVKHTAIKVIGIGGAGGNAVNNMISANLMGVDFIAANTDAQALDISKASVRLQIGSELTKGFGAGANADIGRRAAIENSEAIRDALDGADLVFLTAGFGGGTGTGATPIIAKICKELKAMTVAVVTRPFSFEGKKRMLQADEGIRVLSDIADTVIAIPNDRLYDIADRKSRMVDMFIKADEILHHSVKGISDLITMPGHVNLDFADVKTTLSKPGRAIIGIGIGCGENRVQEATDSAINYPLLSDISIAGAKGLIINISCTSDITLSEMTEASNRIWHAVGDDAEIIWGNTLDESLGDEIHITIIATGIPGQEEIRLSRTTPIPIAMHRKKTEDDTDLEKPTFLRQRQPSIVTKKSSLELLRETYKRFA